MSPNNTDVRSPGGWLQLYGVRIAKALSLGTVASAIVVTSFATINQNRPINFQTNGTQTGSVVQVDGLTREQIVPFSFTATGGNVKVSNGAKYNTAIVASPLTSTGFITELSAECGNVPKAIIVDASFVKSRTSAGSGVALRNFESKTLGTGTLVRMGTGDTLWNPADFLKFNTLDTPGSGVDCKGYVVIRDKYGS